MQLQSSKDNKPIIQKAGVVAYRYDNEDKVELLLISARSYPDSWIFPVGSVKSGETLQEAAARECVEESGYVVDIGRLVKAIEVDQNTEIYHFTFFLARVSDEAASYETDRQRQWVSLLEVVNQVTTIFLPVAQAAVNMDQF